jgi:hypothetical protein
MDDIFKNIINRPGLVIFPLICSKAEKMPHATKNAARMKNKRDASTTIRVDSGDFEKTNGINLSANG